MFVVNDDLSIYITRGDVAVFDVTAESKVYGELYSFQPGDIVRIKVTEKKNCGNVVLQREFPVPVATERVEIVLSESDTKIGGVISKPVDYWYEIELNPYTNPQTLIGYDEDGAKIFKLFPEGKDVGGDDIEVVGEKTLQELVDYALDEAKKSGAFNGDNVYIRYSTNAEGADFTEERSAGQDYIGFATGKTAPTDKRAYEWVGVESKRDLIFSCDEDGNATVGVTGPISFNVADDGDGNVIMEVI